MPVQPGQPSLYRGAKPQKFAEPDTVPAVVVPQQPVDVQSLRELKAISRSLGRVSFYVGFLLLIQVAMFALGVLWGFIVFVAAVAASR